MPLPKNFKLKRSPPPKIPVWKGPIVDGVTQSLLSRFLCCRERFRLLVVHGLRPSDGFNPRLEYGNMWHVCEEALAAERPWLKDLTEYVKQCSLRYADQRPMIEHWFQVCKVQFPLYEKYWAKHKEVKSREPIFQEETFDVPYKLPSGRVVRLRGKYDSVDWVGPKKQRAIWLGENKSKGDIDESDMQRRLTFDLQTMLYLITLPKWLETRGLPTGPVAGVRYNVVRRPLAGGKYSIHRHKPKKSNPKGESAEDYYKRLGGLIAGDPQHFFMRWTAEIPSGDLEKFKEESLTPILESLCDWWEFQEDKNFKFPFAKGNRVHFRLPYGIYNPTLEGKASDIDEYLESGSMVGLQRVTSMFGELA